MQLWSGYSLALNTIVIIIIIIVNALLISLTERN